MSRQPASNDQPVDRDDPAFDELGSVPLHPAQDRGVSLVHSALRHHFYQVAETQLVAQIPAYAQNDHVPVEVPPPNKSSMSFSSLKVDPQFTKDQCTGRDPWLFAPEPLAETSPFSTRWWRDRVRLNRADAKARYSLAVSIASEEQDVTLYNEIANLISISQSV
jgi:hypothetical protein